MPSPFYSLVHLSDLHFSFDLASPFDEQRVSGDVAAVNFDYLLRAHDVASLASADALAAAANVVEPLLSSPSSAWRTRGCLVSGDICTWPYAPTLVNQVYGYFNGQIRYDGVDPPIGFSAGVSRQFLFLLGNHDTNGVLFDSHYRSSPFHQTHHAADLTRIFVVPTPHRWIVFFIVRTDFVATLGWLGPAVLGVRGPAFLERFRRTVEAMRRHEGELADRACTGETYETAIKILVLHHSPLSWRQYPSHQLARGAWRTTKDAMSYQLTRLRKRKSVMRFCRQLGIHLVLFGHTHEAHQYVDRGTLYVDVGTTAAATWSQLQAAAHDPRAELRYDFAAFQFLDDDTLTVQPYTMTSQNNGFDPARKHCYDLLPSGVSPRPCP